MIDHMPYLYRFWAKLPREEHPPRRFHPVMCHLMDVAAVAEALWRDVLPDEAKNRLANNLGLSVERAAAWTAFIVGLHDLGKISPKFQFVEAAEVLYKKRDSLLHALWNPLEYQTSTDAWHQWITTITLPEIISSPPFYVGEGLAKHLAHTLGGHHGEFPQLNELQDVRRASMACMGVGVWDKSRTAATKVLADVLGISLDVSPRGVNKKDALERNAFAMLLAGFVTVSDWIGSNSTYFKFEVDDIQTPPVINPVEYMQRAREKAHKALTELGWHNRPVQSQNATEQDDKPLELSHLFSYLATDEPFTPNEIQKAVAELAPQIEAASLLILEAPMGRGKTEAAMFVAENMRAKSGGGYYFALPTQATSNQMFARVRRFLAHRFPHAEISFQLLHGGAMLAAELQVRASGEKKTVRETTGFDMHTIYDGQSVDESRIAAEEWFMNRKCGLLAPFGVGTVDQALLAALETRHVFVRLFGLANKVVIIDEVHAYDAYMTRLLERLLEWLAALRCSVVLLSATLPKDKRTSLVNAYRRGKDLDDLPELPHQPYPRITWTTKTEAHVKEVKLERNTPTPALRVEWCDDFLPDIEDTISPLAGELMNRLGEGGCAAVICNTVDRAQAVYKSLRTAFNLAQKRGESPPELYLFHARFRFKDRERIEKEALWRFSKKGDEVVFETEDGRMEKRTVARPHRAVLIATQVIEQSLDIDFDLMISDFAPVDLILQRAGRIWRHQNNPRYRIPQPTLLLCRPKMVEGVPRFDEGTEAVYKPYILLRSWLGLNRNVWKDEQPASFKISLLDDIEPLVEDAYRDLATMLPPDGTTEAQQKHWGETKAVFEKSLDEHLYAAELRELEKPSSRNPLGSFTRRPREEDAPEIHQAHQALTRLGDSVQVVCLHGTSARPAFDRAGNETVDKKSEPTREQAIRLLRHAVSISRRGVVETLRATAIKPSGWRKSTLLRHHRLLILDEPIGNYRFTLDDELGLEIHYTKETKR